MSPFAGKPAEISMLVKLADKGAAGLRVVKWQHTLDEKWATLHFGEVKVETRGEQHIFEVQVCLNDPGGYAYSAAVSAVRPPADYRARVIPHCDGVAIPLEDARILWQR